MNKYWRYQGLLESFFRFIDSRPDVMQNDNLRQQAFDHIANKIYEMGYDDAKNEYGAAEKSTTFN